MSSPAVDQVAPAQQYQREWEGAGGSNADPDWRQAQAATELLNTQTVDKIIPLPCFECTLLLSMDDEQQNVLFSDQHTDTRRIRIYETSAAVSESAWFLLEINRPRGKTCLSLPMVTNNDPKLRVVHHCLGYIIMTYDYCGVIPYTYRLVQRHIRTVRYNASRNVGALKVANLHCSCYQCIVAEWSGRSVTVRVRVRVGEWDLPSFFFSLC